MGSCFSKKRGSSSFSPSVAAVASVARADPNKSHTNGDTGCGNSITHEVTVDSNEPMMKLKRDKTVPATQEDQKVEEDEGDLVKEIIVVKHQKSHEDRGRGRDSRSPPPQQDAPLAPHGLASTTAAATCTASSIESADESMVDKLVTQAAAVGVGVRASSCTKEEVDAILIRCGRLSQSPSSKAASSSASCDRNRKYAGSKRSYDFDEVVAADDDQKKANVIESNDLCEEDERSQHRQRHRQSSKPSSSSQGRRRTPSRERDRDRQQCSSSRERRVSRSPGRRSSENTTPARTTAGSAPAGANAIKNGNRPGKIVSVPATVSSLVMDKSNNGGGGGESATASDAKRKNVGNEAVTAGLRYAASPRSKSPARANVHAKISNNNQQLQASLSRSSSKKGEQSPYRRNPLSEIDPISLSYSQPINSSSSSKVQNKNKKETEEQGIDVKDSTNILNPKPNAEIKNSAINNRTGVEGANYQTSSRGTLDNQVVTVNCIPKEKRQSTVEEGEEPQLSMTRHVTTKTVVVSGAESQNPQTPSTRTRSSRRLRDLDLNPETLLNPNPSYATLLVEDIQHFHQKKTNTSVYLPPCVTKACSILEAVADLNSTTSSNLSCAFSEDRRSPPTHQSNRTAYNFSLAASLVGNTITDTKEPFIESEIAVADDVMEPSFHKYVTVRRGCGEDMEDQESSGSNSFVSDGQQHWGLSSSSWEPESADSSTSCWTSRLNIREEDQKMPLGFEGSVLSESSGNMDEARKGFSGKKRDCDRQQSRGIGRGRLGGVTSRGLHSIPVVAAAAST
ncbi:uncharacterized protein At1g65710-like [Juglans microcarpa x Juglans regia]|uniref:uncharacterized protein At1g65710-like n=1 Tax=Juglans microcarpa x Juglans regia TaxID=2249226 RepID=UPI001B7DC8C4|nr:uncharacterized protein At1g65710-like [Juglans microcarpa x Juglans regia]